LTLFLKITEQEVVLLDIATHDEVYGLRITAKDIERWAERREARGELPRLVRRLAMRAGSITEMAFPAGDSVSRPG
jgi:hypothetical protein